jgi:hypothetical protein
MRWRFAARRQNQGSGLSCLEERQPHILRIFFRGGGNGADGNDDMSGYINTGSRRKAMSVHSFSPAARIDLVGMTASHSMWSARASCRRSRYDRVQLAAG